MSASFRALENETFRLYESGQYRAALDVLVARAPSFPALGHRCRIALYRACLLARSGEPDAALGVFEDGLADGLWWSEAMLADDDLDSCRGDRLDRIASRAPKLRERPGRFVTESSPESGVLVALHGGGEVVADHDDPWVAAVLCGWTVHRPVSSQRSGAGLATWTDLDVAVEECRAHLDAIGPIDAIGSFSLGGSLALRLISEVIRVPVIMVAPSLRPAVVVRAASNANGAVIRIVTGEHDPYLDGTKEAVATLEDAGADIGVVIVSGLAHDFPTDFSDRLPALLDEIGNPAPPSR